MVKIDYEALKRQSVEQIVALEEQIERNIRREFERKRQDEEEAARKKRKKRKRKQRKA
jgi:hypothetical protein